MNSAPKGDAPTWLAHITPVAALHTPKIKGGPSEKGSRYGTPDAVGLLVGCWHKGYRPMAKHQLWGTCKKGVVAHFLRTASSEHWTQHRGDRPDPRLGFVGAPSVAPS